MSFDFGLACTIAGGIILGRIGFNIVVPLWNVFINNCKQLTLAFLCAIFTYVISRGEPFGWPTLVIEFVCYCVVFVMLTDVYVKKDEPEIE